MNLLRPTHWFGQALHALREKQAARFVMPTPRRLAGAASDLAGGLRQGASTLLGANPMRNSLLGAGAAGGLGAAAYHGNQVQDRVQHADTWQGSAAISAGQQSTPMPVMGTQQRGFLGSSLDVNNPVGPGEMYNSARLSGVPNGFGASLSPTMANYGTYRNLSILDRDRTSGVSMSGRPASPTRFSPRPLGVGARPESTGPDLNRLQGTLWAPVRPTGANFWMQSLLAGQRAANPALFDGRNPAEGQRPELNQFNDEEPRLPLPFPLDLSRLPLLNPYTAQR